MQEGVFTKSRVQNLCSMYIDIFSARVEEARWSARRA